LGPPRSPHLTPHPFNLNSEVKKALFQSEGIWLEGVATYRATSTHAQNGAEFFSPNFWIQSQILPELDERLRCTGILLSGALNQLFAPRALSKMVRPDKKGIRPMDVIGIFAHRIVKSAEAEPEII
jgi:hypothetical protein